MRRRVAVVLLPVVLVIGVAAVALGGGLGTGPIPTREALLRNAPPVEALAVNEVVPETIEIRAQQLRGKYLLEAGVGSDSEGLPRVVFTIYEPEVGTDGWRPVSTVDAAQYGAVTLRLITTPRGEAAFAAWVGAPAGADLKLSTSIGTLTTLESDVQESGFFELPASAASENSIHLVDDD